MTDEVKEDEIYISNKATRRIVVTDDLPAARAEVRPEIRGRRLETPPADSATVSLAVESAKPIKQNRSIRPNFLIALVGGVVVLVTITVLAVKALNTREVKAPVVEASRPVPEPTSVATESDELTRIEEQAKQVIRRISRDNRPYSFSQTSLREIQSRATELSRSTNLAEALNQLESSRDAIGAGAAKEGLQPSLVMLLGLALTNGGESGDCAQAAKSSLPVLASLNKTFGSNEGDSCLILIAAFREGAGTRRSHPLLKRINQVVTNPLTERNVWYLNQQGILSAHAYELVIDTIAFGVIVRNPRQFGLEKEPLNF